MKYSMEEILKMNKIFRKSLKPNWQSLDWKQTDKGNNLPKPSICKTYEKGEIIELDKDISKLSDKPLYDVIMSRRSVRKYQDVLMTLDELSYILQSCCYTKSFGEGYAFGVVPSGGATSTLETYIYISKVEGLKQGLYHFMKDTNNLQLIREDVSDEVANNSITRQLRGANLVIYWTATPYRAEYKYQFVSHKMIAIEAGHACQNLYLASEALDYGVVAIGAYNQKLVDELLQVGDEEFVIYCATVGKKLAE